MLVKFNNDYLEKLFKGEPLKGKGLKCNTQLKLDFYCPKTHNFIDLGLYIV